ncbi:MAG: hypothetical protein KDC48_21165, partial [Planctomycetes bacterium]|nr:hypothetical protein [Planctomycetota bacterium]
RRLLADIEQASRDAHLVYQRDGVDEAVRVLPLPLTMLPDQLAYLHSVTLSLHGALKRLPDLYFGDQQVRAALRLPDAEERWLRECWGDSVREHNCVVGRHDAVVDLTSAVWKSTLHFVEPNMGGIGGIHLLPGAEGVIERLVLGRLHDSDGRLQLERGHDMRNLLAQEMLDHLEAIGRPAGRICFVEPKYSGSGPDEQEDIARHFHDQLGIAVCHADPTELELRGEDVFYEGEAIDLAYRDYSVEDLEVLEADGGDVGPMRALFLQNRMVSSIAAELDQKSCFEVFTEPALAARHFTAAERQLFRRHVPWTRLLYDRESALPGGERGDLLEYVRHERERLVLKPNRAWGGEGVAVGPTLTQGEWESRLDAVLAGPERYVAQQLVAIPVHEFPVLGADGRVHVEPFYTVMGFAPSTYGMPILGRASQKQVVNVAQRGGLCVVVVGHPPPRIAL